jgi:SAM-dependent methyltransferase
MLETDNAINWELQAKEYSSMTSSKDADPYEFLVNYPSLFAMMPKDAKQVLDLGCGSGEFTQMIYDMFDRKAEVHGWDVSPTMVKLARENNPQLVFAQQDLEEVFPEHMAQNYDLVIAKLVLMFVVDLENVAKESLKVLKPGGSFIVSVPHPAYWFTSYLQDRYRVKEKPEFRVMRDGYFSEVTITRGIGGNSNLEFGFIHRTFQTYINSFINAGFALMEVHEPQLNEDYIKTNPNYSKDKMDLPMRLNLRFVKPQF